MNSVYESSRTNILPLRKREKEIEINRRSVLTNRGKGTQREKAERGGI